MFKRVPGVEGKGIFNVYNDVIKGSVLLIFCRINFNNIW